MKKSVLSLLMLTSTAMCAESNMLDPNWWFEVRHRDPKGVGYNTGYTSAELFLAPGTTQDGMMFIDLRGHLLNDGRWAANGGIGGRRAFGDIITGLNVFYDYREVQRLGGQNQIGAGGEVLTKYVDFRLNGYAPFGNSKFRGCDCFSHFRCNDAFGVTEVAATLPNIDAELGTGTNIGKDWAVLDLYLALGTYYLFEREVDNFKLGDAWGVRGRVDLRIFDGLRIGAEVTYDDIFKTRGQGYIGLSLPLGTANMRKEGSAFAKKYPNRDEALRRGKLLQQVYRQEIIPVEDTCKKFKLNQCENIIFVCNLADCGTGTYEFPYPTLLEAQNNSCPGDIIYVTGGERTTLGFEDGFVMKDCQRLISSAAGFDLNCVWIPPTTPCRKPMLTNMSSEATVGFNTVGITLAECTEVAGFIIEGLGRGFDEANALAPARGFIPIYVGNNNSFIIRENEISNFDVFTSPVITADAAIIGVHSLSNGNIEICDNCFILGSEASFGESQFAIGFDAERFDNMNITISGNVSSDGVAFFGFGATEEFNCVNLTLTCNRSRNIEVFEGTGVQIGSPSYQNVSFCFDHNVFNEVPRGIVLAGRVTSTDVAVNNSCFTFCGNTFWNVSEGSDISIFEALLASEDVVMNNSSMSFENNRFSEGEKGSFAVAISNSTFGTLAMNSSSFSFNCNYFEGKSGGIVFEGPTTLVNGSTISATNNAFFNNFADFAFLTAPSLDSSSRIQYCNNLSNGARLLSQNNPNNIGFIFQPDIMTNGQVTISGNRFVDKQILIQFGTTASSAFDSVNVCNNLSTFSGGANPEASVFGSNGGKVCVEGNSFAGDVGIFGDTACLRVLNNSADILTIGIAGSMDVESPNLMQSGVENANTANTFNFNGVQNYVPLGSCGCNACSN